MAVAFEVTFGSSFAFSGSVTSENFYRDKITEDQVVALSKFGNVKQNNREFKIYDATVAKTSLKIASSNFSIHYVIM